MISVSAITTALACWAATHVASLMLGAGGDSWQRSRQAAIQRERLSWLEQVRAEEAAKHAAAPQVAAVPPKPSGWTPPAR